MSESARPNADARRCVECHGPLAAGRYCGDCLAELRDEPPKAAGGSIR